MNSKDLTFANYWKRAATLHLSLALLFLFLVPGCQSGKARPVWTVDSLQLRKVCVVGFQAAIDDGQDWKMIRNPVTGASALSQPVSEAVVSEMTQMLFDLLMTEREWELIPPEQAQGIAQNLLVSDATIAASPIMLLQEMGKALDADAVLSGFVYRWRERQGTDFGVERAASVAFDLYLVRPSDGFVLWRGFFEKTQKSLFENLLDFSTYVQSEGRWVTASRLALMGLQDLLKEMPGSPKRSLEQKNDDRHSSH